MSGRREELVAIYRDAVRALSGEALVSRALRGTRPPRRVLAWGKAAESMLRAVPDADGLAIVPAARGAAEAAGGAPRVERIEGDHPVPGAGSYAAGARLLSWAAALPPGEELLVLLSGGASSLAEAPDGALAIDDLGATTAALLAGGAPIDAINAVRKHLSRLKGGRLARALGHRAIRVLAISDVPGDDPAVLGSGPFSPDPSTYADALAVVERFAPGAPPAVRAHLRSGAAGAIEETPKRPLPGVSVEILAGPLDLAREAARIAEARGFSARTHPSQLGGDVEALAARHAAWLLRPHPPRTLLACAAEPTIRLPPRPGAGGRSQHLALLVAMAIRGGPGAFLAAGSDGRDGLSEHAGACVDGASFRPGHEALLARAASAEATEVAIPRWETGTNLADLHLLAT